MGCSVDGVSQITSVVGLNMSGGAVKIKLWVWFSLYGRCNIPNMISESDCLL